MPSKTIKVSTVFPATAAEVWEKMQQPETLCYIAAPFVVFEPLGEGLGIWREGRAADFRLKIFGLISFGGHRIRIAQADRDTFTVQTHESGTHLRAWNHRIALQPLGESRTRYTDEIEVDAGWKTAAVYGFGVLFFRHRQRRWLRLLAREVRRQV